MNLNKHDAQTEMEMNMTPMIDVVFLLIIFFMIITDMTQQELEELVLPIAVESEEDKPDPKDRRAIVNVLDNGTIIVNREVLYDADNPDDYLKLREYLTQKASRMKRAPLNEDGSGPMVPDDPILIRADQSTEFRYIQKIMEQCGYQGIQIWKLELAAKEQDPNS